MGVRVIQKMDESEEKENFRSKPRDRKPIIAGEVEKRLEKPKSCVVIQEPESKSKGMVVPVRFNEEEKVLLEETMDSCGFTAPSTFLKDCLEKRVQVESFKAEKTQEIVRMMRRLGITVRMVEKEMGLE